MPLPFNKADIESLVNALASLGATSEEDGKKPSEVIAALSLPKDERLMDWLSELKFPGLKKDRDLLTPVVDWNRMLLMWLTSSAVDKDMTLEVPQPSKASKKKTVRGKAVVNTKAKVAAKAKKVPRSSKKKVEATKADTPFADLVATIRKEFGLSEKLTMIQTIVEAESQLNISDRGTNVKQRAQSILDLL